MSVDFSLIKTLAEKTEQVFMQNPGKILLNFWTIDLPKRLSSDHLYALKSSALKKYRNNLEYLSLLVLEDVPIPPEVRRAVGLNIVITKNPESFRRLKSEIQEIFDRQARISNYSYELESLCHSCAPPLKLLETGYRYMNNPLLLFDTTLTLICHCGVYSGIDDTVINFCLEERHLPGAFLSDTTSDFLQVTNDRFPDLLILDKQSRDYISSSVFIGRIFRGSQLLGYLALFEYNHSISSEEASKFRLLRDFLSFSLTDSLARMPVLNPHIEDFITNLISERLTSADAIEADAAFFRVSNSSEKLIIALSYDVQHSNMERLYSLKNQLQRIFHHGYCTFYLRLLVLMVDKEDYLFRKEEFKSFLAVNQMVAGVSTVFRALTLTSKHYAQALACLKLHSSLNLEENCIEYSDWKLTHLFINFQNVCELSELIPPYIQVLQEMDNKKDSHLVETLFAYVRHSQNISNAAAELYLHYNTMKYRLNLIQELTNINLDDPECMFEIAVAERAYKLLNKIAN